jgi:rhodanese-related sulfurtransferase
MPIYLVLIGLPGAGKGTQADFLSQKKSLTHVSSGDLFRDNIKRQTELGKQVEVILKNGALVIDVRSSGEFASGHLPVAINVPLDEIETVLPQRVKDKNQVLLLHCQSGTRSGMAKTKLKRMGYPNVFNLGSYGRAETILKQAN